MNNQNINPLTQYINHLAEQGKSINTIKSYSHDIGLFFEYFGIEPQVISRDQIIEYKEYLLKERNVDAKTINRRLSALKSYNEFLVKMGYQENLIILSQDYIKTQQSFSSPTNVSPKEVSNFINKIKDNEPYRNYAIVYLIANTGLRVSEALNIKLTDLSTLKNTFILFLVLISFVVPLNYKLSPKIASFFGIFTYVFLINTLAMNTTDIEGIFNHWFFSSYGGLFGIIIGLVLIILSTRLSIYLYGKRE